MKDLIRQARARARDAGTEGEEVIEAGFTLIELMVVLLIIAILLAIAIPTFLGVSNTATDRAAQSNLSNALTESAALYQVTAAFSGPSGAFTSGSFAAQAPEFTWVVGGPCATSVSNCVSAQVFDENTIGDGDAQGLSLAVDSTKTNTCWYVFDLQGSWNVTGFAKFPTAGVFYGKSPSTGIPAGGCKALNPDSDGGIDFTTGGQNYSTADTVS